MGSVMSLEYLDLVLDHSKLEYLANTISDDSFGK
jgi:hypothetical protein